MDHAQEGATHFQRLFLLLSHDHAEHDVRRRLRDGTAVADKTAVGNDIAVGLELETMLSPQLGSRPQVQYPRPECRA